MRESSYNGTKGERLYLVLLYLTLEVLATTPVRTLAIPERRRVERDATIEYMLC